MNLVRLSLILFLIIPKTTQTFLQLMKSENERPLIEAQANFTKNFLRLYNEFSLMFHVENFTAYKIEHLLKLVHEDIFGEIMLVNHDTVNISNFKKRKGSPLLHLVILNNPKRYSKFLKIPECLTAKDVVIFMIHKNNNCTQERFWNTPKLDWAGNLLILNISSTPTSLYNVCFYCGELQNKLKLLHIGNLSQINCPIDEFMPRNFDNFYKHRFDVGYVNSFPHMLCEHMIDKRIDAEVVRKCEKAVGVEMEILKFLSIKLNFKYFLTEFSNSLSESDKDINNVGSRKIDFIIGAISMTTGRAPKMSFTASFAFEPYTFLYIPKKMFYTEFLDNLRPFRKVLWTFVLLTTVGFSLILHLCTKSLTNSNNRTFSLCRCFKICFKAVIEQTERVKTNSFGTRVSPYVVLTLWWFTCLIIVTAYKSKLWAISIKNYNVEPSNLQQLLDNGYSIVVNSENTDIIEDILNEWDPVIRKAKKRLVLRNKTCSALSYALNHKAAMLDEYGAMQYHALIQCSKLLKKNVYSKLRITRTPLRYATHSWPLRMGAPYKQSFDIWIGRILAGGFKRKWTSNSLSSWSHKFKAIPFSQTTTIDTNSDEEFLRGFISSFIFLFVGLSLAAICFIVEILYNRFVIKGRKLRTK